jgi:hypothetical protein
MIYLLLISLIAFIIDRTEFSDDDVNNYHTKFFAYFGLFIAVLYVLIILLNEKHY